VRHYSGQVENVLHYDVPTDLFRRQIAIYFMTYFRSPISSIVSRVW